MGVLDGLRGFAFFAGKRLREMAEAGVQGAIGSLHDARVVILCAAGILLVALEMAFPFPGGAFVIGNLDGEAAAAAFGVVADENPMAVAEAGDFSAGTGIRKGAVGYFAPRFAAVARSALMEPFGGGAIVAHESEEGAVFPLHDAGLDVAERA